LHGTFAADGGDETPQSIDLIRDGSAFLLPHRSDTQARGAFLEFPMGGVRFPGGSGCTREPTKGQTLFGSPWGCEVRRELNIIHPVSVSVTRIDVKGETLSGSGVFE
jgi:hypothetical protein